MTVKDFLLRLAELEVNIAILDEEIKAAYVRAAGLGGAPEGERVQSSGDKSRMENATIDILKLKDRNARLRSKYEKDRQKGVNMILSVKRPEHKKILYKKYVEGKTLQEIAQEMGYSESRIRHMHGHALQSAAEIMKVDT